MSQPRDINLIPHDVLLREQTQRRMWIWAGTILLCIMCLSGIYGIERREISAAEEVIADLSVKKLEIEKMIRQVNVLQEKRDRLARKERGINTLLSKRSISFLFAELEKDMNENVWMTSFNFKNDFSDMKRSGKGENSDEWVETGYFIVRQDRSGTDKSPENEVSPVTTLLRGIAKSNRDLALFLEQLSTSEIFSDVNLKYSREGKSGELNMLEFEIETHLKNLRQM